MTTTERSSRRPRLRLRSITTRRAARKGPPSSVLTGDYSGRLAIKRAQFVAVGIAQISEIHLAGRALAHAGRVLDRFAAIRDTGFVPSLGLVGTAHQEADRTAIGMAGRLAVDRFGHHKASAIMRVGKPSSGVLGGGLGAHRAKQRVIEFLRSGDVVTPYHDMAELNIRSAPGQ